MSASGAIAEVSEREAEEGILDEAQLTNTPLKIPPISVLRSRLERTQLL